MDRGAVDKKILWIDCAKFIAMLAVIIDHLQTVGYVNSSVISATSFSVSVFIFLSGITGYYSVQRHQDRNQYKEILRRLTSILLPYMGATFIYQVLFERFFNLLDYLKHLVAFDMSGPFYFVAFYIQLVVIAPLILLILSRCKKSKHSLVRYIVLFLVIVIIAISSIKYSLITDGYGGARYLFGGTYLIMYFLGMLCAHVNLEIKSNKSRLYALCISFVLCGIYFYYMVQSQFELDRYLPFGDGKNPPGLLIMGYTVLILIILYCGFSMLAECKIKYIQKTLSAIGHIGEYSLFIFLYHELVLSVIRYSLRLLQLENYCFQFLIYIPLMLGVPVIMKKIFNAVKRRLFSV